MGDLMRLIKAERKVAQGDPAVQTVGDTVESVPVQKQDSEWPPACLEAMQQFGHRDALLYPLIHGPVQTPQGVGVLLQVLGGRAVVEFEGLATVKHFKAETIRPVRWIGNGGQV